MAKGLQSRGLEELGLFKKRVNRQYSMERISRFDRDELISLIDQIESKVVRMNEKQEKGIAPW